MTFGDKLREMRAAAQLTQGALALQIGVHISSLRQWEQGKREPGWLHLLKLAEALDADPRVFRDCNGVHEQRSKPPARRGPKPKQKRKEP